MISESNPPVLMSDVPAEVAADAGRWDARIARARQLARERAASAEMLSFYADLAGCQQTLLREFPRITTRGHAGGARSFIDALDCAGAARLVPDLLSWLQHTAQPALARAAESLLGEPAENWARLVETYWTADAHDVADADDTHLFVVEALLQPFAEALAPSHGSRQEHGAASAAANAAATGARCPVCTGRPLVATLRERGHGARRSLICGLCLTEWPSLRVVCPACGESRFDAISVYRAEQFKGLRVDACDACHTYIKTVDFGENGAAVPLVDDLGSLPLDLWACEQGYRKIRPNLLRI